MSSDKSQKWLARVEYDLQTAEAMLSSGRYIYAVFMCQQSIEKTFKALISHNGNEVLPLHNLRRLAEKFFNVIELIPTLLPASGIYDFQREGIIGVKTFHRINC